MRRFGIHLFVAFSALLLLRPSITWAQKDAEALLGMACGPDQAKFDVRRENPGPSPLDQNISKSQVIVFVESLGDLSGCGPVRIGIDGRWAGAACLDTWFSADINPGTHHLCVDFHWGLSGRHMALHSLSLEAGKRYYFRAEIVGSYGLNGAVHIYPLDKDEAELLVNTHKQSRSKAR